MNGTRAGAIALLLSLSLSGLACSSGGGPSATAIQQALEECSQEGVIDVVRLVGNLEALFDAAEGNPQEGLTFTPTANPNEFSYSLTFPLSGNGPDDTRVSGLIAFSADPSGGIEIDDTADLSGTISSLGGPLTGSFDLDLVFTEAGVSMTGDLLIDNADGCDFDISINATDPLVVVFNDGPQIAVNILGLDISGTLFAAFNVLGQTIDAVIVLLPGLQDAMVSGDLNSEPFDTFEVKVFPDFAEVEALVSCFYFGGEGAFVFVEDLGDVYAAIFDPGSFPNIDIQAGTAQGSYDFVADMEDYTIEGTITLPADPNGTGTTTFTVMENPPLLTGFNPSFTGSGSVFINFLSGDPVSLYGSVSLMRDDGCMVDTTFHQSDPILLNEEFFDSGTVTFVAKALGNTLTIVVDFAEPDFEDGIIEANINGISIPGDIIFQQAQ